MILCSPSESQAFYDTAFVRGFEEVILAEIQGNARFFPTKSCTDEIERSAAAQRLSRFAYHIDAVGVAHSIFTLGDEALRFVSP